MGKKIFGALGIVVIVIFVFHVVHYFMCCRYKDVPGKSHCGKCMHKKMCDRCHHIGDKNLF